MKAHAWIRARLWALHSRELALLGAGGRLLAAMSRDLDLADPMEARKMDREAVEFLVEADESRDHDTTTTRELIAACVLFGLAALVASILLVVLYGCWWLLTRKGLDPRRRPAPPAPVLAGGMVLTGALLFLLLQ